MGQTFQLQMTGAVQMAPVASLAGGQSMQDFLTFNILKAYTARMADSASIVGATDLAPYVLPLGTISAVRFLAIHVMSGAIKAVLTNGANPPETNQVVRFGDWLVIHAPNPGEELTAIKLVGTADVEYVLAGDAN